MSKIEELLNNEKVEWKKLGEVCQFNRGQAITKKEVVKGLMPVIGGGKKPAYYHNCSNRGKKHNCGCREWSLCRVY